MKRVRRDSTSPELLVRRWLHARGFRFRINQRGLPGRPDIVLRKYGAVVFVHGCFWHAHEGCRYATVPTTRRDFWTAKFEANRERDARKEVELRNAGWRVAVVWECATRSATIDEALDPLETWLKCGNARLELPASRAE